MSAVAVVSRLRIAVLCAVIGSSAVGQQAQSLLVGGDFEAGTGAKVSGWSLSAPAEGEAVDGCLARSTERTRSGQWSLKVDTGPVVGRGVTLVFEGAVSDDAAALRGQPVALSGWVYVEPGTALRPIQMDLQAFGGDGEGKPAPLGSVLPLTVFEAPDGWIELRRPTPVPDATMLSATVLGEPGAWTKFRAVGIVPDAAITGMKLHCSLGPDVVRTVQFLDDLRLEPQPLVIRPLRSSLWRDEAAMPVAAAVSSGEVTVGTLKLRLLNADGKQVAAWERDPKSAVIGLALPKRLLPEGDYVLSAQLLGDRQKVFGSAEAPVELALSPWEGAPAANPRATPAARLEEQQPGFQAMGTRAPTEEPDALPTEPEPTSQEVKLTAWEPRGYVVFSRPCLDRVSRLGRPRPGEVGPVRLFACPGEYEPAAVSVWALRPQKEVEVTVSDLQGEQEAIAGSCVDVRVVRTPGLVGVPAFLEQRPTVDIPAGQTQTFWLTLHVPQKATPGFYRGQVSVRPEGGPASAVELLVRVLPLELPPPQKGYGFWWAMDSRWNGYYSKERDTALEQIRKQFLLLHEHGCNMVALGNLPRTTKRPDGTVAFDFEQEQWDNPKFSLADLFRLGRETGFFSPKVPIQYPGADGLHGWWIAQFLGLDQNSTAFEDFFREACRRVNEWATQQGFTLAFACVDEISNSAERQREALRWYRIATEAGVLTSVTDNSMPSGVCLAAQPRFDEIIAMRVYNWITPEMIENARASGDHLWLYNMGSAGWDDPKRDRLVFGLFTERCGAEGFSQWAFQWPNGDAGPYDTPYRGKGTPYHYALPAPDGPLPTLTLEAVREGIDDARYLALVRARSPESAAASLDDIEALSSAIPVYLEAHDASAFDVRRWRMAREAMKAGQ